MRLPANEKDIRIKHKIYEYQDLYKIDHERLAQKARMSPATLSRRLSKAGAFTVDEIRRIAIALNIPATELTQYI